MSTSIKLKDNKYVKFAYGASSIAIAISFLSKKGVIIAIALEYDTDIGNGKFMNEYKFKGQVKMTTPPFLLM